MELSQRERSSADDLHIHAPPDTDTASLDENQDVIVIEDPINLRKRALKNKFLITNINHKQGNLLLKTLRQYPFNMTFLPKDTRTLLHTPTAVVSMNVQIIVGGEYLYIGLRRSLLQKLQSLPTLSESVGIDICTDGAQVEKGLDQFWKIQFRIVNINLTLSDPMYIPMYIVFKGSEIFLAS